MYKVTAKLRNKVYTSQSKDLDKALLKLDIGSDKDTKVILTVTNGEHTKERVLPWRVVSRFFNSSGLHKELALKQISILFS